MDALSSECIEERRQSQIGMMEDKEKGVVELCATL